MLLRFLKVFKYIMFIFFFLFTTVKAEIRFLPYFGVEQGVLNLKNNFFDAQKKYNKSFFLKPTLGLKLNNLFFLETGYYHMYNSNKYLNIFLQNSNLPKYYFFDLGITKCLLYTTDFFFTFGGLLNCFNNKQQYFILEHKNNIPKLIYGISVGINHLHNKEIDFRACVKLQKYYNKTLLIFSVGGVFYV